MMGPTFTLTLALGGIDWVVIAAYAALLLASGVYLARSPEDSSRYFLAGRSMPAWAVALSTLATSLSAATFVAAPDIAYGGDLRYLSATLGTLVAAGVVGFLFLPALYASGVATVYELLGRRFGPPARTCGSAMFLLGRVLASGARVYIAAHALAFILFGNLDSSSIVVSVWVLVGVGIVYTVFGGIATVIWTDVIQSLIFFVAVLVAVAVLWRSIGTDTTRALEILRNTEDGSKLRTLSVSLNPSETFTLWTALIGFALLNIGAYGTDQDLAQRLMTCKTKAHAARSLAGAVLVGVPVTGLFMLFGLLLYVKDVTEQGGPIDAGVESMMRFVSGQTGALPAGVAGLLIAGLFASGLSSLDSALNAMASSFVNDFVGDRTADWGERRALRFSRACVAGAGVVLGLCATACVYLREGDDSSLIEFALGVMVFAYAGLVGVFLCALATKRGTATSAVTAMLTGMFAVIGMALAPLDGIFPWDGGLAFPWQLTIGVALSFAVCMLGRSRTPYPNTA